MAFSLAFRLGATDVVAQLVELCSAAASFAPPVFATSGFSPSGFSVPSGAANAGLASSAEPALREDARTDGLVEMLAATAL